MKRADRVIALTVAGSDSGGGAGIQADLSTWTSMGVHGTTAVTCLTAQNPVAVTAIQSVTPRFLAAQLEALQAELPPRAIKTGMLLSAPLIREFVEWYSALPKARPPVVVDPVMVATSGADLLRPGAVRALTDRLFPLAALITPNLAEASRLLGRPISQRADLRPAAFELHFRFGCAVLVKGGHLTGGSGAIDLFFDGETELELSAPFIRGLRTHGTGCRYSAAIAGHLALGQPLPAAVELGKRQITRAIAQSVRIAGHTTLNLG